MQKANTFDSVTLKKIGKGALIALTGGAAIALLDFIGTIEISNPALASIIATLVPVCVNAVKEWKRGSSF